MDGLAVISTTSRNPLVDGVQESLQAAIAERVELPAELLALPGMSGRKYRAFINSLIRSLEDPRYLEIGVWKGSTLCSAVYGNKVSALAIDNWSEFDGPASEFFANLGRFKGSASVSFLDSDFRDLNYRTIGKFNVFLFDGPHSYEAQRDGLLLTQHALDDAFVLIVDDWNWERVRRGTFDAIATLGYEFDFAAEIRTSFDDSHAPLAGEKSDWHNGYFIAACHRRKS
jgi:hypothetical protein